MGSAHVSMDQVKRHFLGWDGSIPHRVSAYLLPSPGQGICDLQDTLVIVPTRQAGRRVREALAVACDAHRTGLLSPLIMAPAGLLAPDAAGPRDATPAVIRAAWSVILRDLNPDLFAGLFPTGIPSRDFVWALQTGDRIQELRATLVEGRLTIEQVAQRPDLEGTEIQRWEDLAKLEQAYLSVIEAAGFRDPHSRKIEMASAPQIPPEVRRIVVACVPDPPAIVLHALAGLSASFPVDVLVAAPPDAAHLFDDWGRPDAAAWTDEPVPIPDAGRDIVLAGSPHAQSREAMRVLAEMSGEFAAEDYAIGVADREVVPHLEADLAAIGIEAFDPAEVPLGEHALSGLIRDTISLLTEQSYAACRTFLRNAFVLDCLFERDGCSAAAILEALDRVQNETLPSTVPDLIAAAREGSTREKALIQESGLQAAMRFVQELIAEYESGSPVETLGALLRKVCSDRVLRRSNPEDAEFETVAQMINDVLLGLSDPALQEYRLEDSDLLAMVLRTIGDLSYARDATGARVDLEGWLELPWNDAPVLVVTGMNEGHVPDSRLSDAYVPDSMRVQLGLRSDVDRLARDAFLMRVLVETRRAEGRAVFVCGKRSHAGDPLQPSRLMFRCQGDELVDRARALFGPATDRRPNVSSSISFLLEPAALADEAGSRALTRMGVTLFQRYLACPFRFYLGDVLGLKGLDDEKTGPDALDFGSMMHHALELMATDPSLSSDGNESGLADALAARAEEWCRRRFGPRPDLPVRVALDSAAQRLRAAARVQLQLTREGWDIEASELKLEVDIGGLTVVGKIDRIDRHRETGAVRIIDYKTSDTAQPPDKAHLALIRDADEPYQRAAVGKANQRWTNLQLPLYDHLARDLVASASRVELGYFNLPKAVSETGLYTWKEYGEAWRDSARDCAGEIVRRVSDRQFWPPADRVRNDDFSSLFMDDPMASIAAPPWRGEESA